MISKVDLRIISEQKAKIAYYDIRVKECNEIIDIIMSKENEKKAVNMLTSEQITGLGKVLPKGWT